MSDTPPRQLPAELIDIVVDFLHDDKKSLANCALISKAWLPVTRYHLFRKIYIHESNVNKFKKLFTHRSRTPTVMPHHIHSVVIDQVRSRHSKLFDLMYYGFQVRPLDSVRTLKLRNIVRHHYTEDAVHKLVSAFRSVTDMRLDLPVLCRHGDLFSLVARFPLLQRLSVTNPTFSQRLSHRDISENLPPPKIHDLVLTEIYGHPTHILEWFSFHGVLVDSLSVHLENSPLQALNRDLNVLGPSLLFFSINLRSVVEETAISQLDLSFNTHLRKLRFQIFPFGARHMLLSPIPAMFARITSSDLEEIEFPNMPDESRFLFNLQRNLRAPTSSSWWSALDRILSGFNSLRTVRFTLSPCHSDPSLFVGYMRRALSSCNARGLLSFEQIIDGRVQTL